MPAGSAFIVIHSLSNGPFLSCKEFGWSSSQASLHTLSVWKYDNIKTNKRKPNTSAWQQKHRHNARTISTQKKACVIISGRYGSLHFISFLKWNKCPMDGNTEVQNRFQAIVYL